MTQGERLLQIVHDKYRGNKSAFAEAMGVSYQTLQPYFNNKLTLGTKMRDRLKKLDINPEWVVYGEGGISIKDGGSQIKPYNNINKNIVSEPRTVFDTNENESRVIRFKNLSEEELMMKYANHPVGAGYQPAGDANVHDVDIISILTYNKKKSYFAEVAGDSMIAAEIHPGDFIIINTSFVPENEDVVVVFINGDLLVKRFRIIKNERYLVSDNTAYLPINIDGNDEVKIFGVVETILHKVRKRDKVK